MSSDIKDLFFSKNNVNFTFEQVRKNIQNTNAYDINKNRSFKTNYNKMLLLVFENTNDDNKNLVNLNNLVVEKTTNYFNKLINNRNEVSGNASSVQSNTFPSVNNMNKQYNDIIQQRKSDESLNEGSPQMYMPLQNNTRTRENNNVRRETVVTNDSNINVLPFTLSDEFINEVNNADQPIYNNMKTLEKNEEQDPMMLMKEQANNRDIEMQRYTNQLNQLKQNSLNTQPNTFNNNNQMSIGRDDALIDTRIDNIKADPVDLYRKNNEITNKMIDTMTDNNIEGNLVGSNHIDLEEHIDNETVNNVNTNFYQNTKYFEKRSAQLIVIQKAFTSDNEISFSEDLMEPLIVDSDSDVFLEFINLQNIEYGTNAHLENINCFALDIEELPLKTSSNNEKLNDKYIIPNESFGLTDNSGDVAANATAAESYNIKLKSNYMCSITPRKLSKFTIKLYGLQGATLALLKNNADAANGVSSGQLIIGLYIVKK
jgi:hypothetical protein